MTDLIATAFALQTFCEEHDWQPCFIGGLAVQALGEARLTNDADMTLLTGFGGEEIFIQADNGSGLDLPSVVCRLKKAPSAGRTTCPAPITSASVSVRQKTSSS
jgi:hypothetical protein